MAVDCGCDFPLKWFLHCITARFSKSDRDFLNGFVKMCLNWYDEPPAKLLLNFLFENREIPDMDDQLARYFANAMFQFAQKHPVLIRCMPQIQHLVHAVGNERLLKYLGIHAFPFYFDCEGIREHLAIRDLTTDEVRMILMSNCRRSIWACVQDVHFLAYQYPFDFPDAFSPALCSLTSSSVAMRIHFFDVVAGSVKKCLEDLNLDAIPLFIRTCPIVAPFLIVAYHSIIYRNPLKYARLIMASVSESVASHIIERFRNDVRFLEAVRPPKVAEMPIDYVTAHSIPFLFVEKLSDDQALEFTERKYYIYDEQATAQDRDFLLSLRILWAVLELISMQKLTSRAMKETGARVKQYLESLQAPSKVCIDLFSLIFLRDKVGNFICHASIARQIVKLVNSFCPNVYVKRAISCLFNQKIRGVSSDINDYWTSVRSDFLNKLAQKNFDVAKAYISIEPTLRREYVLSWSMNSLETESSSLVECSMYKTELNLELGMSNPHFSECLSYSLEHVIDDILKLAIRNRLCVDPGDWLKHIRSEQWERMVPIARNLDKFPNDFFATRQFSRFRSILTKSILDFVKYLDLYYRCRLLYCQVTKKRLANLLEFNPLSALQGAFNVGDYQKAQKIAGLFGINLFVYVLERPSKFRVKKKTLDYFRDQYELECMALRFDPKRNNLFDHRRLSGILERYWRTTKKYRSLQSRIHRSSSWSDLIEDANLTEVTSQGSTADLPRIDESILEDENPLKKSQSLLLPEDAKAPQQDSSSTKLQKRVILTGTEAGKPQPLLHRRRQSVDWDKGHKDGNRGRLKPQRVESDTSSVLHLHFQMQIPIEESEVVVTRPSSTGDLSKIEGLREETELANRLLELLQNPETDPRDLDDYIYRISPKRCCNIITENIDTISHMLAGYVCEVCCYSEELSRKRIVQSLLVRRKIEKVTSADDDDGIVGELVQLRRYKLAAEFIRRFARDKESLVVKYVRNLLTNTTELRNFMMALPDFFEVIASDVDEAIPVMADFCPDSIRPAFLAFESLPVEVRIVSSLVDRSTIAKAFCSGRIDLVRYLRRQHLVLFSDEDLTAVLAESARTCIFKYFAKDAVHLSSLVRNKALFIDICSDRVQREINEINVSCIEDEFEASLLTDKMFAFSQFCALHEPVARMLRNLVKFFDHKPYSRTHIPYNFNSPSLFEICFELDLDELAFEFTAVDKDAYIAKRISTELYLGRFEDANDFLAWQKYEFKNVPIEYLNPFLHKEVFYYEGIDMMIMNGIDCFKFRGEPAQMPFYRMIVASCKKMKKTLRIGELHTFLDRWCDFRTRIKFYTQFGEISRTVDILKGLPVESILEVIPMMLETSVAFKYQTRLMKELARCDSTHESVWKALSAYLSSRNMNYILSEAYLARGQLEDVAQVSYRLCTESPLISNKVFHIANAVNALLESEKQSERKVSRTMEMSEEERQNMKEVFQLLYDVYNFLYRQHVVELQIEDRDHDPDGVIVTGSLLVELKNEELLERFVSTFQISKAKIFAHFFDKMSAREPQDVIAYVDATKNDKGFWAMYHHEFVRSLACSKNSSIIAIVIHDICPPDQVIGLLLECDRLKEAYTCAINKNNLDLLPLIAFRASQLGDTDLVRFCEKHF